MLLIFFIIEDKNPRLGVKTNIEAHLHDKELPYLNSKSPRRFSDLNFLNDQNLNNFYPNSKDLCTGDNCGLLTDKITYKHDTFGQIRSEGSEAPMCLEEQNELFDNCVVAQNDAVNITSLCDVGEINQSNLPYRLDELIKCNKKSEITENFDSTSHFDVPANKIFTQEKFETSFNSNWQQYINKCANIHKPETIKRNDALKNLSLSKHKSFNNKAQEKIPETNVTEVTVANPFPINKIDRSITNYDVIQAVHFGGFPEFKTDTNNVEVVNENGITKTVVQVDIPFNKIHQTQEGFYFLCEKIYAHLYERDCLSGKLFAFIAMITCNHLFCEISF